MEIKIFLENYQIDTDDNSILAMTMCYSHLNDPTTVAGDYSKTITIPGTVNNNNIFGQIWNLDRTVLYGDSNTSVYFNPSKKTDAKIFIGNEIFKTGYVQLNTIEKNKGVIKYNITFYSELCNVLHKLLDSSLCNLNFPSNGLRHIISASSINSITSYSYNSLSPYMSYGLTIDGVYDNFNASQWLTKDSSGNTVVANMDANGTKYDTAMILQAYAPKVRPFVKVDAILNQIRDDFNKDSSTKLIYDDDHFFNSSNPYCVNSVMSCKTYDTDNASTAQVYLKAQNFSGTLGVDGGRIRLNLTQDDSGYVDENGCLDMTGLSGSRDLVFECMLRVSGNLDLTEWSTATSGYSNNYYGRRFESTFGYIGLSVELEDVDTGAVETLYLTNTPWYTSGIPLYRESRNAYYGNFYYSSSPLIYERSQNTHTFELAFRNSFITDVYTEYRYDNNTGMSSYVDVPRYSKMYTNLSSKGYLDIDDNMYDINNYEDPSNDYIGVTDFFPFVFKNSSNGASRTGKYKVYLKFDASYVGKLRCANKGNTSKDISITTWYVHGRCGSAINLSNDNWNYLYRNTQSFQAFKANSHYNCPVSSTSGNVMAFSASTGIVTGGYVKFKDMVDSDITQGDFLINYSKLFGLIYDTDSVNIDNTISLKTRNSYHSNYKIYDWTDKIDYNQGFKQTPLTFNAKFLTLSYNPMESYYEKKYLKTYDDEYGIQKIDTGYDFNDNKTPLISNQLFKQTVMVKGEALLNGGAVPGYFDKSNNERSPIDAQYSLLFLNTDSNYHNYKPAIRIIDDSSLMHDTSIGGSEEPCWIDSSRMGAYYSGQTVNLPVPTTLRAHEVQLSEDKSVTQVYSWDLGYPQSNYAKWTTGNYPSTATIYSNYWKSYIADLYDVNTRILKCYVHLTPAEMLKFSFKDFVKIDDTLWHPNQIIDYNPLSNKPVQVELVKVNDIDAYINSQTKWFDYCDATFTVSSTDYPDAKASSILKPVTGGIIKTTDEVNRTYNAKFRRGAAWSQSFTYGDNYGDIYSVSVKYFDPLQNKNIDCTEWFDKETLTLTVPENSAKGDLTFSIDVKSGTTFYSVACVDDNVNNVKYTAVIPSGSIPSRLPENSELKVTISCKKSGNYKLVSKSVTMGGANITSSVFTASGDGGTVYISKLTGDVIMNFVYMDTADVLLPYIMNSNFDFSSNHKVTKDVFYKTTITPGETGTSLECIGSTNVNYNDGVNSPWMGMSYATTNTYNWGLNILAPHGDNKTPFSVFIDNGGFDSKTSKYSVLPYGESASYPIRYVKAGFRGYEGQYFNNDTFANFDSIFMQINEETQYTTTAYKVNRANRGPIYLFGSNRVATGAPLTAFGLTKIYTGRIFNNGNCVADLHPVLHYIDNVGFEPCFYDSISKTYIRNSGSDEAYYSLDSNEDIVISWIGNGTGFKKGNTWFDINGVSVSNDIGIQIVCSSQEYTATNVFEMYDTNYPSRSCSYGISDDNLEWTTHWGSTSSGLPNTVETGQSISSEIRTVSMHLNPSSKYIDVTADGYTITSDLVTDDYYTGSGILTLFKTNGTPSSTGIRIYELRAYRKYSTDTSGGTKRYDRETGISNITYLKPVLHYTGTTTQYTSNEGFKAPLGYEPCFYDVMNNYYYYKSSNGNPVISFGFY